MQKNIIRLLILVCMITTSCDKAPSEGSIDLADGECLSSSPALEFSFRGLFSGDNFYYKKVGNDEYIIAQTSDNIVEYRLQKNKLREGYVDTISLAECEIPIFLGNPIVDQGEVYSYNCDKYYIKNEENTIVVKSKYEMPICSIPFKVKTKINDNYVINIHNALLYDGDNPLISYMWKKDKTGIKNGHKRLIFKKPLKNQFFYLVLQKNISKDFTLHLEVGERRKCVFVKPCIRINKDTVIYFGLPDDDSLLVVASNGLPNQVSLKKDSLKEYTQISVAKNKTDLEIKIRKSIHAAPEIYTIKNVVEDLQWSDIAIGSYQGGKPFELFSATIVGKAL